MPLTRRACIEAARIYADLLERGELIPDGDILIAGIALANDCVVVTNNLEHFSRIKGLGVESWM